MPPLILDGRALAADRLADLRQRARRVAETRGTAPRLLLLGFEEPGGRLPWVGRKLRACEEAGIEVRLVPLAADVDTHRARTALRDAMAGGSADGVFVQSPFPAGIDPDALSSTIPPDADVDAMSPVRYRAFQDGGGGPPLTVAAALELLDAYGVRVAHRKGLVVGEPTPFNRMYATALGRRGARVTLAPVSPGLADHVARSDLVVASAGLPGVVRASDLPPGSIAVDAGYFNPGGRGDIDLSGGIDHLEALVPVPGGLGPMTVSALLEAVIARAEDRPHHATG